MTENQNVTLHVLLIIPKQWTKATSAGLMIRPTAGIFTASITPINRDEKQALM